ncbi:phosphodiesterase [Nisaea sp.]|uniref:phosphodiesterase n=1 Tax=Nisaea sp. TaxID=2024842 RepID=UPI0032997E6B
MLKFLHLSDLHLVRPGTVLHGLDPAEQLSLCVTDVLRKHADAAFCVVSGDLTHSGNAQAYEAARDHLSRMPMPVHLMMGNHDDRTVFQSVFPDAPRDGAGFVQHVIDVEIGRLVFMDTSEPGRAEGRLCRARLDWLRQRIEEAPDAPIFLFLHHPPFCAGLPRMDQIRLQDAGLLLEVLRPDLSRIRHLFVGHLHRAIAGSWHGVPFSGVRGTSHQIALDFTTQDVAPVSFETPGYGVVMASNDSVVVHFEEVDLLRV